MSKRYSEKFDWNAQTLSKVRPNTSQPLQLNTFIDHITQPPSSLLQAWALEILASTSARPSPAARRPRGGEAEICAEAATAALRPAPRRACSCATPPPHRPPQTPIRPPPPAAQTARQQPPLSPLLRQKQLPGKIAIIFHDMSVKICNLACIKSALPFSTAQVSIHVSPRFPAP